MLVASLQGSLQGFRWCPPCRASFVIVLQGNLSNAGGLPPYEKLAGGWSNSDKVCDKK